MPCASVTLAVIIWVPLTVELAFGLVILIFGAVGLTVVVAVVNAAGETLTVDAADACNGTIVTTKTTVKTVAARNFSIDFDKLAVIINVLYRLSGRIPPKLTVG